MNKKTIKGFVIIFILSLFLTACDSQESTTTVGGLEIVRVTYSKEFTDEGPSNITSEFYPTDTICLTVEIKGRPEEGTVTTEAYWNDQFIDSVEVDLSSIESDETISVEKNTYASAQLTPAGSWPISKNYRFVVTINGESLGEYPFTVIPPADAIPTVIDTVTLAKGVDENFVAIDPTTEFAQNEPVVLVANGDFGKESWFRSEWILNGEAYEDCLTEIKSDQDYPDNGVYFSCIPETGWPVGNHSVTFSINDEEFGTYTFTVK